MNKINLTAFQQPFIEKYSATFTAMTPQQAPRWCSHSFLWQQPVALAQFLQVRYVMDRPFVQEAGPPTFIMKALSRCNLFSFLNKPIWEPFEKVDAPCLK